MQSSLLCKPVFALAGQHNRHRPPRVRVACLASLQSAVELAETPALPAAGESEASNPRNQSSTATTSGLQAQEVDWETFIRSELFRTFQTGEITATRYSPLFQFTDPIYSSRGFPAFQQNLRLLRTVFDIDFVLHDVKASQDEVITRWTFMARIKALPVARNLVFTGTSFYRVENGVLVAQRDVWDAVDNNDYLSAEGIAYVMRMALSPITTPDLEGPRYTVLRKRGDYEVRRYEPYLIAEVAMPPGSSPAAGTGFNDLAGYIFGGNNNRQSMEMTTPVLTTAGQGAVKPKMAFVMESQYTLESLPIPRDARVDLKQVEGGKVFAVGTFSGLPLDFEVVEAERRLRGALLVDGLTVKPGYTLARYNDPFTLPFVRRNEVLIELEDFEL